MTTLTLVHEMSLEDYRSGNFPQWIDSVPLTELLWDFTCDDQECEGATGSGLVRVWRKLKKAA